MTSVAWTVAVQKSTNRLENGAKHLLRQPLRLGVVSGTMITVDEQASCRKRMLSGVREFVICRTLRQGPQHRSVGHASQSQDD